MAKERDVWLDVMEDFIGHPGWKLLEEDCKARIEDIKVSLLDGRLGLRTWEDVNFARGVAAALAELLNFPEVVANRREQHNEKE